MKLTRELCESIIEGFINEVLSPEQTANLVARTSKMSPQRRAAIAAKMGRVHDAYFPSSILNAAFSDAVQKAAKAATDVPNFLRSRRAGIEVYDRGHISKTDAKSYVGQINNIVRDVRKGAQGAFDHYTELAPKNFHPAHDAAADVVTAMLNPEGDLPSDVGNLVGSFKAMRPVIGREEKVPARKKPMSGKGTLQRSYGSLGDDVGTPKHKDIMDVGKRAEEPFAGHPDYPEDEEDITSSY